MRCSIIAMEIRGFVLGPVRINSLLDAKCINFEPIITHFCLILCKRFKRRVLQNTASIITFHGQVPHFRVILGYLQQLWSWSPRMTETRHCMINSKRAVMQSVGTIMQKNILIVLKDEGLWWILERIVEFRIIVAFEKLDLAYLVPKALIGIRYT